MWALAILDPQPAAVDGLVRTGQGRSRLEAAQEDAIDAARQEARELRLAHADGLPDVLAVADQDVA